MVLRSAVHKPAEKKDNIIHTKFKVMLLSTPNSTLYSSKRLLSAFMYCS